MIELTSTWLPPIWRAMSPQKFSAATTFTAPAAPGFEAEEPHAAPTTARSATREIIRAGRTPL